MQDKTERQLRCYRCWKEIEYCSKKLSSASEKEAISFINANGQNFIALLLENHLKLVTNVAQLKTS